MAPYGAVVGNSLTMLQSMSCQLRWSHQQSILGGFEVWLKPQPNPSLERISLDKSPARFRNWTRRASSRQLRSRAIDLEDAESNEAITLCDGGFRKGGPFMNQVSVHFDVSSMQRKRFRVDHLRTSKANNLNRLSNYPKKLEVVDFYLG